MWVWVREFGLARGSSHGGGNKFEAALRKTFRWTKGGLLRGYSEALDAPGSNMLRNQLIQLVKYKRRDGTLYEHNLHKLRIKNRNFETILNIGLITVILSC